MSKISQESVPLSTLISSWTMHKGERVERHYHDLVQLVYPSAGIVSVTTAVGSWMIPPNKALLIPALIEHEHQVHGIAMMHTIKFYPTEIENIYTKPQVIKVSSLLKELIITGSQLAEKDQEEIVFPNIKKLIIHFLEIDPKYTIHLPIPNDPQLYEVCEYIMHNMMVSLSLRNLSFKFGFSERTLSRLFHMQLGMTYPQWRNQVRLYFALELLARGKNVQYIAHHCGWTSSSNFIDVFRKYTGTTPGKFFSRNP